MAVCNAMGSFFLSRTQSVTALRLHVSSFQTSVLTERVVFIQRSIDFAVRMDLQMIFGSAVKFPASRRSSEVFVHSSAPPGVSPMPGVASLARSAAGPCTNRVPQAQQQQQSYHQHRGMAGKRQL